ncbi:MAG: 16S rRNA (guanine(966)-N(2))-methyltransferase RsmD [Coriobacteriia bacterium]|nr:16S rRNA (guanine(966)-N(2))-methyltransferase RsmD [Coriobacteriia bacterium]
MRIIAGTLRGKIINAPEGSGTRPTIDRVRESLFSSLYSLLGSWDDVAVLDAFAGSGALGLEALSRGAKKAVFFEQDKAAAAVVQVNIATCRLTPDVAVLRKADVLESPPVSARPPFDLVFLDPPYALPCEQVAGLVDRLRETGALSQNCLVCYEHASAQVPDAFTAALGPAFSLLASKRYGKVAVDIYERIAV